MTEPYRNADTRLKAAFAALRAEIVDILGEPMDTFDPEKLDVDPSDYDWAMLDIENVRDAILDYAKQPASEG
jgi:hypothetical protein